MKIGFNIKLAVIAGIVNCLAWLGYSKTMGYYSLNIYNYRFFTTILLVIIGVFVSIYFERKAQGGFIQFKIALKTGVVYSLVLGVILSLFNFIYHKLIVPDAIEFFVSEERKAWLAHGKTLEDVNKYLVEYYIPTFGPFHILMTTIMWGIMFSLFASAIFRKKNPHTFSEN
jgi:hypothetical protein